MRRLLFILVSILVSGGVLALAIRDVPLEGVGERLGRVDMVWVIICAVVIVLGLWARGIRWQGLLGWKLTFWQAFHSSNIMFMLNFLPLRLGEVARAALATRYGVPFMSAATGVLIERVIDTVLVVVVLSFMLARLPDAPPLATQAATLFGIGALVAFALLLLFARVPALADRLLNILERVLPFTKRLPLRRLMNDILSGLEPLTHWRGAAHVFGWTIIAWIFSFSGYYAVQRAFHIEGIDLVQNSLLSISLIAFSIAIPVTLASIGPFQGAARIGGEALGLSAADSLSLGVLYHVMTFIVYGGLGVIGLIALGVSLGDVTRNEPKTSQAPVTPT